MGWNAYALVVSSLALTLVQPDFLPQLVPQSVTKEFRWTPRADTPLGPKTLTIVATDNHGASTTQQITIVVEAGEPVATTSGGGGDGGGGGGGGGEPDRQAPQVAVRTFDFPVSTNHQLTGIYSGLVNVGSKRVAKLASPDAALSRAVSVPTADYWLDVRVKHDRPEPVKMAVDVNNRAWKTTELTKADNQYYTHRLGQLRNFHQGTIRFRLLNDTYDRSDPTNEEKDRNLFIESWRLTAGGTSSHAPTSQTSGRVKTARRSAGGIYLLPKLNSYIRQELGAQHVRVDIWKYYAWRLTLPANNRYAITTVDQLVSTMRYWKSVSPDRPRGERL